MARWIIFWLTRRLLFKDNFGCFLGILEFGEKVTARDIQGANFESIEVILPYILMLKTYQLLVFINLSMNI